MIYARFRCSLSVAAVSLLVIAGNVAASDQFEGQVTFKTKEGRPFQYLIGKKAIRVEYGQAMAMIMNFETRKMITIMPMMKRYSETTMPDLDLKNEGHPAAKIKKTGKTEMVAGVRCEVWSIESDGGATNLCVATGMGTFQGLMSSNASPGFQEALRQSGGGLLLKLSGSEGTMLEAIKVERKAVDPSLFLPPAGFQKTGSGLPFSRP